MHRRMPNGFSRLKRTTKRVIAAIFIVACACPRAGEYLSLTANQIQFFGPGGEYTHLGTYTTDYAYRFLNARTNITLPALGGITWVDGDGYISTTLYNSDPFGLQCDSDFHVYGTLMCNGGNLQFNRWLEDSPNRRNWSITSEVFEPGDLAVLVSEASGHTYGTIPVVLFRNDLSADFMGRVTLESVSAFRHYVEWHSGPVFSAYTGSGAELYPHASQEDFGIRVSSRLLLSAGNRDVPDCILDDEGFSVPHLIISGTGQSITFGSTSSPPVTANAPAKWIKVRVSGEDTEYKLPLYQ